MMAQNGLVVIESHPIQYHAPVYRQVQMNHGIPVTVVYGSDFSVAGYRDQEFGTTLAWDTDLLSGYTSVFLSKVSQGGPASVEGTRSRGLRAALNALAPAALLLVGYSHRFHRTAILETWMSRYPILFRAETIDHAEPTSAARTWTKQQGLRLLYRRCSKLLYIGQRSYGHYRRIGCADNKLIFSPYCVNTEPFDMDESSRSKLRSRARQKLDITDEQVVFLFSGKLSERKGPDLLVSAVKQLSPEIRGRAVVVFLGSGELKSELLDQAQREPRIEVCFTGFQNQTQLSPYYHAADLLVLPSRHSETWGLVVNEALHHGVPCVASEAVGCAADLIEAGVTGEVFATGSVPALASALERALGLINQPGIRDRCRAKVSRYSIDAAAAGIAEAFRAVAN